MITKINKKNLVVFLMIVLLIIGCFIWYGELGTNKEAPKKARFVSNFLLRSDNYR